MFFYLWAYHLLTASFNINISQVIFFTSKIMKKGSDVILIVFSKNLVKLVELVSSSW